MTNKQILAQLTKYEKETPIKLVREKSRNFWGQVTWERKTVYGIDEANELIYQGWLYEKGMNNYIDNISINCYRALIKLLENNAKN